VGNLADDLLEIVNDILDFSKIEGRQSQCGAGAGQ
jgi:signal transduction histidine kinase